MLKSLVAAAKAHLDKSRRLAEFRAAAVKAVQDGILTTAEVESLERLASDLELSENDIRSVRSTVFSAMLNAVRSDQRLSNEELESLDRLYAHFGIQDKEISGRTTEDLNRMRLLFEIEAGYLPELDAPHNLVMKPGEVVHWAEPAEVFEQRTRDNKLEHVSGGHGTLVLTSYRVIFVGTHKNYEVVISKMTRYEQYPKGLELYSTAKSKPPLFTYQQKNAKVIAAVMTELIRRTSKPVSAKPRATAARRHDISRG